VIQAPKIIGYELTDDEWAQAVLAEQAGAVRA
jgi:hypothetical protein